jgi:hypothetical protein
MSRTAVPFLLLKVLDLLAHFLEHTLARQRGLAQLEVVGLARNRVHLSSELLQQEVERPPDRPPLVEHQRQLGQVRSAPGVGSPLQVSGGANDSRSGLLAAVLLCCSKRAPRGAWLGEIAGTQGGEMRPK